MKLKTFAGSFYSPVAGFATKTVKAETKAKAKKLLGTKPGYRLVDVYEA